MARRTVDQFIHRIKQSLSELERDANAFLVNAAQIAIDERKKGFMDGKGPEGENWPALSQKTIEKKSRRHKTQRILKKKKGGPTGLSSSDAKPSKYPSKPLIDTGNMMNATAQFRKNTAIVKMARSRSEPVSGNFESIAAIHQKGLGKNPERPHWGIYKAAHDRITKGWSVLVEAWVRRLSA